MSSGSRVARFEFLNIVKSANVADAIISEISIIPGTFCECTTMKFCALDSVVKVILSVIFQESVSRLFNSEFLSKIKQVSI